MYLPSNVLMVATTFMFGVTLIMSDSWLLHPFSVYPYNQEIPYSQ